jgi:hypothetical protein
MILLFRINEQAYFEQQERSLIIEITKRIHRKNGEAFER